MKIYSVSINKQLSNNAQHDNSKEKTCFFSSFGNSSPALDISAVYNLSFMGAKGCPVYAISADGNYQKFNSQKEAADALGVYTSAISACLAGRHYSTGGMSFARAKDVEIKNENGTTEIDDEKIKEYVKYLNYAGVYLISQDGSYKKYNSQTEAAEELGVLPSSFSKCSKGILKIGNVCAIKAFDFEVENKDGTTGIKKDVLEKCTEELGYTTVYFIKQDGSYKKYNSQTEAAAQIGVSASAISNAISGKYKIKGMIVKRGCDIESLDENGRVCPDEDKIKEVMRTFKN
ncbi:MAG: helix-turn-helix transcriptional regulator [Candidatus Gastranaerophilales bacterium]|nr:helix-turn-helix transcriptional regulator [Candidatus Gastranaerophilales bacterium]